MSSDIEATTQGQNRGAGLPPAVVLIGLVALVAIALNAIRSERIRKESEAEVQALERQQDERSSLIANAQSALAQGRLDDAKAFIDRARQLLQSSPTDEDEAFVAKVEQEYFTLLVKQQEAYEVREKAERAEARVVALGKLGPGFDSPVDLGSGWKIECRVDRDGYVPSCSVSGRKLVFSEKQGRVDAFVAAEHFTLTGVEFAISGRGWGMWPSETSNAVLEAVKDDRHLMIGVADRSGSTTVQSAFNPRIATQLNRAEEIERGAARYCEEARSVCEAAVPSLD